MSWPSDFRRVKATSCACWLSCGCRVTGCWRKTPAAEALAPEPDGIFLVERAPPRIRSPATTRSLAARVTETAFRPSASASITRSWRWPRGQRPSPMKFGHHGGNHPVKDPTPAASRSPARTTASRSTKNLPKNLRATARVSLFDGTPRARLRPDGPAPLLSQRTTGSPPGHERLAWPVRPFPRPRWEKRLMPRSDLQKSISSSAPARSSSARPASSTTPAQACQGARRRATASSSSAQPGDDHDRPGFGRRRRTSALHLVPWSQIIEGAPGRAPPDARRPDGAELRARPLDGSSSGSASSR